MLDQILDWDTDTLVWLNNLGIESSDNFWLYVTQIITWIPLFVFFFILMYQNNTKKETFYKVATIILATVCVVVTMHFCKEWVGRLRPNNNPDLDGLIRELQSARGFSFFSGHASSSFVITTMVVLFLRKKVKLIWVFYLWPLLFSFSRIYVGVHYPLDILTGTLFGVLSAFLFYKIYWKVLGE